ncbi:DMT family transporter [Yoonia sp. 208BN28-4]|uniref:DMT family transporter n=1 Tax=Yoonia sp. 208BN28-4 TaxID=3126505 RepID=UPI00309D6875
MQQKYPTSLIGLVVLAMTCIVGGDAAGKVLTGQGFSAYFVAWARFSVAVVVIAPFCGLQRAEMPMLIRWPVILRAALISVAIACILTALKTEPMANVFGGFFIGPVVAYFLSALVLGERISFARTALLMVSFAGVLLVVKPGFGMTAGMGFAVLAGCLHGSYLVTTRWLAGDYRPRFLLFSQLAIGAVILAPMALGSLPPLTWAVAGLLAISALGSAGGNFILVNVSRTTPAGVIAPLIYSQLLVAMVLGLVVFGDFPDGLSLIGLVVIAVAGVASVWFAGRGR